MSKPKLTYDGSLDILESALKGPDRARILDEVLASGNFGEALRGLRNSMRTHTFDTGDGRLLLEGIVKRLDERTQEEGFHVLHEWDGKRFLDETIPVMMVDYFARANKAVRPDRRSLAILLDYYFLYVVALFLMRIWDEGDPNAHIDRLTDILGHLQGPNGSGLELVDDAPTLLWIAISHYEPDDFAYHRLLDKVRTLHEAHQTRVATVGAAVLGDHLRWGFPVYYERDLGLMRADNVSDYPWLLYAVTTLLDAYARLQEDDVRGADRDQVVEALLNGLTPDARAFSEGPPSSLQPFREEHKRCRELLSRYAADLIEDFEAHRPSSGRYSPLGFQFNFPHNVLIPVVTLALVQGMDPKLNLSFNALLRREGSGVDGRTPETLARTLMAYAGYSPEKRAGRRTLMIIYDPNSALSSFNRTLAVLKEVAESAAAGEASARAAGDLLA